MKIIISESQYKRVISEVKAKAEDRDKIYEDERIVVVAPLTHKGSCKYGSFTKWCTATPSNDENFKEYINNGVLIYFIVRSPYPESGIKEYKFAYYKSYTKEMEYANGWYDMGDYQFEEPDENTTKADIKLIKFLIPEFVINKVNEYIKEFKPKFEEKIKASGEEFRRLIIRDVANVNNTIINNNDWFIFFRLKNFGDEYLKFNQWYPIIHYQKDLTVFYFDKRTNNLYFQELPYVIDISVNKYNTIDRYRIMDINGERNHRMFDIFMKYYNEISDKYYFVRKIAPYNGNTIYLFPQLIQPGDIFGSCDDGREVTKVVKSSNGEYNIQYKSDGKIINNGYYSKDIGAIICYNEDKHNPPPTINK